MGKSHTKHESNERGNGSWWRGCNQLCDDLASVFQIDLENKGPVVPRLPKNNKRIAVLRTSDRMPVSFHTRGCALFTEYHRA